MYNRLIIVLLVALVLLANGCTSKSDKSTCFTPPNWQLTNCKGGTK